MPALTIAAATPQVCRDLGMPFADVQAQGGGGWVALGASQGLLLRTHPGTRHPPCTYSGPHCMSNQIARARNCGRLQFAAAAAAGCLPPLPESKPCGCIPLARHPLALLLLLDCFTQAALRAAPAPRRPAAAVPLRVAAAPPRASRLDGVEQAPPDPILGVSEAFKRCEDPAKLNLGAWRAGAGSVVRRLARWGAGVVARAALPVPPLPAHAAARHPVLAAALPSTAASPPPGQAWARTAPRSCSRTCCRWCARRRSACWRPTRTRSTCRLVGGWLAGWLAGWRCAC